MEQAGLSPTWSETSEDRFSRDDAHLEHHSVACLYSADIIYCKLLIFYFPDSHEWEIFLYRSDGWLGRKFEEDKGPGFMRLIFDKGRALNLKHEVLVNSLGLSLPRKDLDMYSLYMTIVVDWDVKQNSNKHVSPCRTDPSWILFASLERKVCFS